MQIPSSILIVDSGIFLDGGSIRLEALDQTGNPYSIFLERSFKTQDTHTTQLYVNKLPVIKRMEEEETWLGLLEQGQFQSSDGKRLASLCDEPWTMDASSSASILQRSDLDVVWMTKYLTHLLISHVRSDAYVVKAESLFVKM